jgi:hypothetical protein
MIWKQKGFRPVLSAYRAEAFFSLHLSLPFAGHILPHSRLDVPSPSFQSVRQARFTSQPTRV